jgi:hypothetical protein
VFQPALFTTPKAAKRVLEFFTAQINNDHTCKACLNKHIDDAALLAWRARNLLELSVWSTYCAKTRENARRVYEDEAATHAASMTPSSSGAWQLQRQAIGSIQLRLRSRISPNGRSSWMVSSLWTDLTSRSAKPQRNAVSEHFSLSFKMLSKFAHPTAMRILAAPDEKRERVQRDLFFSHGCLFFTGAFHALEGQLLDQK